MPATKLKSMSSSRKLTGKGQNEMVVHTSMMDKQSTNTGNRAYSTGHVEPLTPDSRFDTRGDRYATMRSPTSDREGPPASSTPSNGIIGRKSPSILRMMSKRSQSPAPVARSATLTASKLSGRKSPAEPSAHASYAAIATAAARASASSAPNAAPASMARASGPPVTSKPPRRTQRVITPQMVARRKININNFPLVMKSEEESKILTSNASVAVSVNTEATEKVCNRASSVKSRRRKEKFEPELEQVNTFESLHADESNEKHAVYVSERVSALRPDLEQVNTFESLYTVESDITKVVDPSKTSSKDHILEKVDTFESLHTVGSDITKLTAVNNAKATEKEELQTPVKDAAVVNEKFAKIVAVSRCISSSDNFATKREGKASPVYSSFLNDTKNTNKMDDKYSGFFLGEVKPKLLKTNTVKHSKSPENEANALGTLPPRPITLQNNSNGPLSAAQTLLKSASLTGIAPSEEKEKKFFPDPKPASHTDDVPPEEKQKSSQPLLLQISSSSEVVDPDSSLSPRNKEEIEIQLTLNQMDEIRRDEVVSSSNEEKSVSLVTYAMNTPEVEEDKTENIEKITPAATPTSLLSPVKPPTLPSSPAVPSTSPEPAASANGGSDAVNPFDQVDLVGPVVTDLPEQKDKETILATQHGGSEQLDTDPSGIQGRKELPKCTDLDVSKNEKSSSLLKYIWKSGTDEKKKKASSGIATPAAPPAPETTEAAHLNEKNPVDCPAASESAKADPAKTEEQDQPSKQTNTDTTTMSSSILKLIRKSGTEEKNASSHAPEVLGVSRSRQLKAVENVSSVKPATLEVLKTTPIVEENIQSSNSSASSEKKNSIVDDGMKDSVSSSEKDPSPNIGKQHESGAANTQASEKTLSCACAVGDKSPDPKVGNESPKFKQCNGDSESPVVDDSPESTKNEREEESVLPSKHDQKPVQQSLRAKDMKPDSKNETGVGGSQGTSALSKSGPSAKDDSDYCNDECQTNIEIDQPQVVTRKEAVTAENELKTTETKTRVVPNRKKKRGIFSTFLGKKSKVIDEEKEYEQDEIDDPKSQLRMESTTMNKSELKVDPQVDPHVDPHVKSHAEAEAEQGAVQYIAEEIVSDAESRKNKKAMHERTVTIAEDGDKQTGEKPRRSLQQREIENDELDIHLQATLSDAEFFSVESSITTDKEAFAPVLEKTGLLKRTSSLIRNQGLPLRRNKSLNKSEYDEHLKCMRNGKSAAKADNKRKEEFDDFVDAEEVGEQSHQTKVEQVPSKDAEIQCTLSDDLRERKTDMPKQNIAEKGVSFVGSEDSSDDIQALRTIETFDDTLTNGARFSKVRNVSQLDIGTGTLHDATVGPGLDLNALPTSPSQQVRFKGVEGGTQTNFDRNALNDPTYPIIRTVSSGLEQAPHRASSVDHSTQTSVEQEENVGSFSKIMESMALFSAKLCIGTGAAMVTCANSCSDRPYNSAQIIASNSFVEGEAVRQLSPRSHARMQESSIFRAPQQDTEKEATDIFSRALAMALRQVSNNEDHQSVPSRQNSVVKQSISAAQSSAGSFDQSDCEFVSVDGRLVKAGKKGRRRKKRVPRNIAVKPKKEEEKEQPAAKQKPGGFLWGKKNKALTKPEHTQQVVNNNVGDPAELNRVDSAGKAKKGITKKLAKGVKNIAKARLAVMYEV
ncbi:hypothetical protein ACHAXS_008885 [Conticribra weissflogii]